MIKDAMEFLLAQCEPTRFTIDTREYSDKKLVELREPMPTQIDVQTLDGFVTLAKEKIDGLMDEAVLIQVVDAWNVKLMHRKCDAWGRRQVYATATVPQRKGFDFNKFLEWEPFVIGVQALFVDDIGDHRYVIQRASNITREKVTVSQDDGISQKVGQTVGVVTKSIEPLKTRVSLAPYRTFREVEQPQSDFVFRVRQQDDEVPELALFEADGGAWMIDAMAGIGEYLREKLPTIAIVS